MKKILHITNWYPNTWNDLDGIFIKKQFEVFSEITDSHLINVQVRNSKKFIEYKYIKYSENEEGYYLLTKIKSNKIIELLTTFLLLWALIKTNYKKYDLLHVHIAYPLMIHYFIWKKFIKLPIIISEHWSAYHFNFYMPKENKKLNGIKRIFRQGIPLITVSKSLLKDIQEFSYTTDFSYEIIPNIIHEKVFYNKENLTTKIPTFFIVNEWSKIKNPFPMLEAFSKLDQPFILKIGGYGELYKKIKEFIKTYKMEKQVIIFEKMSSKEIAKELNNSDAYLFSSNYETFSVICAEALSCGCPLIGPTLPAIVEYTDEKNALLFKENDINSWIKTINEFIQNKENFNREKISEKAKKYFSNNTVQTKYLNFLQKEFGNDQ
jgi:glycosyltransferase involved in cell wall biosynthesis